MSGSPIPRSRTWPSCSAAPSGSPTSAPAWRRSRTVSRRALAGCCSSRPRCAHGRRSPSLVQLPRGRHVLRPRDHLRGPPNGPQTVAARPSPVWSIVTRDPFSAWSSQRMRPSRTPPLACPGARSRFPQAPPPALRRRSCGCRGWRPARFAGRPGRSCPVVGRRSNDSGPWSGGSLPCPVRDPVRSWPAGRFSVYGAHRVQNGISSSRSQSLDSSIEGCGVESRPAACSAATSSPIASRSSRSKSQTRSPYGAPPDVKPTAQISSPPHSIQSLSASRCASVCSSCSPSRCRPRVATGGRVWSAPAVPTPCVSRRLASPRLPTLARRADETARSSPLASERFHPQWAVPWLR